MNPSTRENIAKFLYDCGKISFTVLVVGMVVRKPIPVNDLVFGAVFTLIFFILGIIINQIGAKEA